MTANAPQTISTTRLLTELDAKKAELKKLGVFTPTDDYQVVFAQDAAKNADAAKTAARAAADEAEASFAECSANAASSKSEAQRLEGDAKQKDSDAKAAHDELEKLSGWAL